jgi:hypothetical protein
MNAHIHPDARELAEILEPLWPGFTHEPGTLVNESVGGAPAAEGGGEGEGGEGEGETAEPLTRDYVDSAFDSRFEQLRGDLGQMLDGFQGQGGDGYAEGQQEGGEPDYGQMAQQLIDQAAEQGEMSPEMLEEYVEARTQDAVGRAMQQALPQALEQAMAPINDRFLQQDADRLEETYPALAEPEMQSAVVQEAVQQAQLLGQVELARNPKFIEQVYLAKCAREGTAAVPASGEEAALEGAGASGARGQEDEDRAAAIVNAGGQGGGLFSGAFG